MNQCGRFEADIRAYISGDPVPGDLEMLVEHCRVCPGCRGLLEAHRTLADLGARFEEIEPIDLAAPRAAVLREIAAPRWKTRFPGLPVMRAAAAAVALAAVFIAGFAVARLPFVPGGGGTGRLIGDITDHAEANHSLTDVEDSPYTYSNVVFRPVNGEHVALEFDVVRHVDVIEPMQSELVKEVLVHSLVHPSHTGSRLKAIHYASGMMMEPKIRDALVFALRHDDNLAVRMKALSILAGQPADPEIENAVLETLKEDRSVQMRLLALDTLAGMSVDGERILRVIRESEAPGGKALQVRLAEYEL